MQIARTKAPATPSPIRTGVATEAAGAQSGRRTRPLALCGSDHPAGTGRNPKAHASIAALRERSGPFLCRNDPHAPRLGWWVTPPRAVIRARPCLARHRGLALRMLSSSARPDCGMRPPEKITLRRDARAKRSRRPGSTALNLAVFSCAAAPASPSVKPIRRNDVEAMGPAQKCRRMSSMVELVVAIVAFVSACIFLAHAIEAYRA